MNLIYMAKPIYGGWVTFTAHLSKKYDCDLYKISKRSETCKRNYGYDVKYQNIYINDAVKLKNILITAIDKDFHQYLDKFPNGTRIVIHDPTEIKKSAEDLILRNLKRFKVITIRKTVHDLLLEKYKIKNTFLLHPFYEYEYEKDKNPNRTVSISRIDFDKNTDIILRANKILPKTNKIAIYGAINGMYLFHKLQNKLKLKLSNYNGTFEKSYEELSDILRDVKYVVDLSVIKNDGGGTQYTFLEAIHQECALILHADWLKGLKTPFKNGYNCFVVSNEDELVDLITSKNVNVKKVIKNAKKLLKPHISVNWLSLLSKSKSRSRK